MTLRQRSVIKHDGLRCGQVDSELLYPVPVDAEVEVLDSLGG